MGKQLLIKDRVFLGLALVGDLLDQTVGQFYHDAYWARKAAFWTPPEYKLANFYQRVKRMMIHRSL